MIDPPITRRRVAELLGRSETWFRANRRTLEAAGFPKELPVIRLYDPLAIEAWLTRQRTEPRGAKPEPEDWGAILDARAAQMATR